MIVCGIDASSNKSGVAIFENGEYVTHTVIDLHKIKDINKRIPKMIDEVCKYIYQYKPDKILMEETVLNSNVDTIKKLAYLAGGVMFYAYRHNVPFELVLPSQWRKAAGLQQGAKVKREVLKLESMQAVKVAYGLEVGDDASDAILVARSAFDLPKINITENDVDWERAVELD
jgi:Holliday junction resolvasome RuvABC endonuclease subunit